jgi:hypothetical protein
MKCSRAIALVVMCSFAILDWAEAQQASPSASALPPTAMPPPPLTNGSSNSLGAVRIGTPGAGPAAGYGGFWAPGGYEPRYGSPNLYHDPYGGQYVVTGDPYYDHWGPGFHRVDLYGHYRFPYYTYRAPWYYPGRAVYQRDTNFPW